MARRSNRSFERITLPIRVLIGERVYKVKDWSISGFSLHDPITAVDEGDVLVARLIFGERDMSLDLEVHCRAVRSIEGGVIAFEIFSLSQEKAQVLHRIIDDYITGQAGAINDILHKVQNDRRKARQTTATFRAIRSAFTLVLAVSVCLLAAWVLFSLLSTVESRYAAVSSTSWRLSHTKAGELKTVGLEVGRTVSTGEVLAEVVDPAGEDRLQTIARELALLELVKQMRADRRTEIVKLTETIRTSRSAALEQLDERIGASEERVAFEQSQLNRLRRLYRLEAISAARVDTQAATVSEIRTQLSALRQERATLSGEAELAASDIYTSDIREHTPTLSHIDAQVRETEVQIRSLRHEARWIWQDRRIHAPCDCQVLRTSVREGEMVSPGEAFALLASNDGKLVHALVLAEDARHIRQGDRADIEYADGDRQRGRVRTISYTPLPTGRAGLPDQVFAAERFAHLEIEAENVDRKATGLTANVMIRTSRLGWISRIVHML